MIRTLIKKVRILTRSSSLRPTSAHASSIATSDKVDSSQSKESPIQDIIGTLKRPWRRVIRRKQPEVIFTLAKRNYKVYANLVFTRRHTRRFEAILDTGAGLSFIRKDTLPETHWSLIRPLREAIRVKDAGNRSVKI